jgi:hypothetical protein
MDIEIDNRNETTRHKYRTSNVESRYVTQREGQGDP